MARRPGMTTSKILLTLILLSVTMKLQIFLAKGQQQVPCLFFWGDSAFDNGNNNYIISLAKVDYRPYGIDYPDGPTGRFTNGKTIPDFFAEFLGFKGPIPPFSSAKVTDDILNGVNYASGAAGIQETTGLALGRMSMNQQLLNHAYTVSRIQLLLKDETEAKQHLNKCLYILNIGNNDFLNYFLNPATLLGFNQTSTSFINPDQYADIVIQKFNTQLMELYHHGARKLAVFAVAPLGCVPQVIKTFPTYGSLCSDFVNQNLEPFNTKLKSLVDRLNTDLPDSQFVFLNYSGIALESLSVNSIKVKNAPCCTTVSITGLCIKDSVPCSNRNEYVFWDDYHPSQISNDAAAKRMYNAASPTDTYPMDLNHLATLKIN